MVDLNNLCKLAHNNAVQRQQNGANIKADTRSMLKHCATEVVEATEAYTKAMAIFNRTGCYSFEDTDNFRSELADIVCCVLIIAGHEGIDIEDAINECIEKNRKRAEGTGDKK